MAWHASALPEKKLRLLASRPLARWSRRWPEPERGPVGCIIQSTRTSNSANELVDRSCDRRHVPHVSNSTANTLVRDGWREYIRCHPPASETPTDVEPCRRCGRGSADQLPCFPSILEQESRGCRWDRDLSTGPSSPIVTGQRKGRAHERLRG
jgi:hypothetical protein